MSNSEQPKSQIGNFRSPHSLGASSDEPKKENVYESAIRSLVQVEQTFLALLADINGVILKQLQQAKLSDPKGKINPEVLDSLNCEFQTLWDQVLRNYRTLPQHSDPYKAFSIENIYIIRDKGHLTENYVRYLTAFTNFVTIRGFDQVAKQTSDYWKKNKKILQGFLNDSTSETSVAVLLYRNLHEPFKNQILQYSLILTRLSQELGECSEKGLVADALQNFVDLQHFINQVLDEASLTKILWKSLGHKARDTLCTPERRINEDSKTIPIALSSGKSSGDRILLFNDILAILQGSNDITCYNLTTVWVDCLSEEDSGKYGLGILTARKHKKKTSRSKINNSKSLGDRRNCLRIITPEEELLLHTKEAPQKALWHWKINQAIRQSLEGKRDFPLWGGSKDCQLLLSRFASYTFKKESKFKNALYEGDWNCGKPHGKGTMKWPDGCNYSGDFHDGLEDGFGIYLIPGISSDGFNCYKCHWKCGVMQGYGICEYEDDTTYNGYFKNNLRNGFGTLRGTEMRNHPFKYTGHWENNIKSGYGIWDDPNRGQRYIGMWQDDFRHGQGIVVTQSGLCYQGTFISGKMMGKLTFPNGFTLEGTFSNQWGDNLQASGILSTCRKEEDLKTAEKIQLDLSELPMEERWQGIYRPFQEFILHGCQAEMEESYLGFHTHSRKELRKSQDYLFCHRTNADAVDTAENIVGELSKLNLLEDMKHYLETAFESTQNPLGKLLKTLTLAFQATYSGVGANKHLLTMAKEEVLFHAEKITEFIKILHMGLQTDESHLCEPSDSRKREEFNSYTLVLPLILPRFHPELYMMYMLYHEKEDALYWQGIIHLGLLPDTQLLEFLEVQKHLWPLQDLTLTVNQRYSLVRDECFLSAIECFQKISTTVDPELKMITFMKTYDEIEKTVARVLEKEYKLPMDDLLPLLVYVVSRAKIQHLGAELHFIRDMMDPCHEGGLHDFMLTALESCYLHLQKEEIRNSCIGE
ncbi:ALS2 C-terminal-like protein isoform X2 [Protopterus annectens]|uniref:ALS2 C-terminal-like protein isoform X2 n=1 Tax=Protopterus annectens TaxID=7888 RepID=UPI001CFB5EB1|nr:ALS2 C-terminal-like protein isoform X2 [Protopterus annectens]